MHATEPRSETDGENVARSALSRRAFLILSGVATAVGLEGAIGNTPEGAAIPETPTGVLLGRDDLLEGEAYVEWTVDAETAPLARYLDAAVEAFAPAAGAATGFVATADADGPGSIEAAVYPATETSGTVAATDDWVRKTREGVARSEPATGVVEWESGAEGHREVLRLERLPGEFLAFAGASGGAAERSPRATVARHAEAMRSRAERL